MSTNTAEKTARVKKPPFLINRNYRWLFSGQSISALGDQLSTYTIILWIAIIIAPGQPWAPLAISAALVSSIIPNLLIGPFAGVFIDRWNPRLTMIRMDIARTCLALLLVVSTGVIPLPFFAHGNLPPLIQLIFICAITFLSSTCAQFFTPASMAVLAQVVPRAERPHAASLSQSVQAFAVIIGPPLAAPLLFVAGLQWALLLDACSFIVSFLTLRAILLPASAPKTTVGGDLWREFVAGLRFALGNVIVRTIIIASFIATLGAGAFDALYVFFLLGNLHVSADLTGVIAAILGLGTLGGAFLAGKIAQKLALERILSLSLLGIGLCLVIVSRLNSFASALAFFLLFGMFLASLRVAASPMLLNETPQEMIGRVFAVLNPTSMIASLVSAMLAGYLASVVLVNMHWQILGTVFGPIDTIFTCTGLLFLLSSAYTWYALSKRAAKSAKQIDPPSKA